MAGPFLRSSLAWQITFVILGLVVAFLALTPAPPATFTTGWDKLNHALAFLALAVAGCRAFARGNQPVTGVVLGLAGFGALIEILQYFVPSRSSEWGDLFADCVGIAAGVLLARWRVAP